TGTYVCQNAAQACSGGVAKASETCNAVDDDCNGTVDDVAGAGNSCTGPGINTTGACRAQYRCVAGPPGSGPGGLTCVQTVGPVAETCNGIDDDSHGPVDDSPAAHAAPSRP